MDFVLNEEIYHWRQRAKESAKGYDLNIYSSTTRGTYKLATIFLCRSEQLRKSLELYSIPLSARFMVSRWRVGYTSKHPWQITNHIPSSETCKLRFNLVYKADLQNH